MSTSTLYPNISPSLNLDFSNSEVLDPRITFTRASTATYYDGVTTAKAEENLFQYSQEFDNEYWTKTNVTIVANDDDAPDGTATAELMYPASTGTYRQVRRVTSGGQAFSVFAKAGAFSWLNMGFVATAANYTWFDLTNGVVGTTSASVTSATITSVGNGWYRCSVVFTAAQTDLRIGLSDSDNTITATANGTDGLYIWGAQLEQRSSVTSYTATTTQPITNYIPVLLSAAANVPRFDHNPTTGESLGLLIEEQRTNLLTYSSDFSNAAWSKANSTITAETIVAPDGTLTGDKHVPNSGANIGTGNSQTRLTNGVKSYTGGQSYTASIYAKAGEFNSLQIGIIDTGGNKILQFNLSTGIPFVSSGTGATASMTFVGNGWWRCVATWTHSTTESQDVRWTAFDTVSSTGDGYSGIYLWGAQLEDVSVPTSYIATVAATVTRSADAATMTGTNFSSWYNQGEGSLYTECATLSTAYNGSAVAASDGTLNNRIAIRAMNTSSQSVSIGVVSAAAQWATSFTPQTTAMTKFAVGYRVNDIAFTRNGATSITDTSALIPPVNQLRIGADGDGQLIVNGYIRRIAYYPLRLTNAQLQALTT